MPTAMCVGPVVDGNTSVWPGLPSNPCAASEPRLRPRLRGTAPPAATGTPIVSAIRGVALATCTVTVMADSLAETVATATDSIVMP